MRFIINALIKDLISITYHDVIRRKLITPLVVFVSFLVSFALARGIAYTLPSLNFILGQYHIHHFYYGIALLIISNWITLISNRPRPILLAAALFGIGLGVIADEVGLLLTCTSPITSQCDYHARIAVDFFILVAAAFLSVLYFIPLSERLVLTAFRMARRLLREPAQKPRRRRK